MGAKIYGKISWETKRYKETAGKFETPIWKLGGSPETNDSKGAKTDGR